MAKYSYILMDPLSSYGSDDEIRCVLDFLRISLAGRWRS